MSVNATALPLAACFFSDMDFNGQVFCLGAGRGNVTTQQVNTAKSVKVFGGCTVYAFAETAYADGGETAMTADVVDLL